jgi:hypothetical protein
MTCSRVRNNAESGAARGDRILTNAATGAGARGASRAAEKHEKNASTGLFLQSRACLRGSTWFRGRTESLMGRGSMAHRAMVAFLRHREE